MLIRLSLSWLQECAGFNRADQGVFGGGWGGGGGGGGDLEDQNPPPCPHQPFLGTGKL